MGISPSIQSAEYCQIGSVSGCNIQMIFTNNVELILPFFLLSFKPNLHKTMVEKSFVAAVILKICLPCGTVANVFLYFQSILLSFHPSGIAINSHFLHPSTITLTISYTTLKVVFHRYSVMFKLSLVYYLVPELVILILGSVNQNVNAC